MDANFPKEVKSLKPKDKIICVGKKPKAAYMTMGIVKWVGKVKGKKDSMVGVEFEKNVKSKDKIRDYFKAKPGFGALVRLRDVRKVTRKFDFRAFQKSYEKKKKLKKSSRNMNSTKTLRSTREKSKKNLKGNKSKGKSKTKAKKPNEVGLSPTDLLALRIKEADDKIKREREKKRREEEGETLILPDESHHGNSNLNMIKEDIPLEKSRTEQTEDIQKKNEEFLNMKDSLEKYEEENKKLFIEQQKNNLQLTQITMKNKINEKKLSETLKELELLKENYNALKEIRETPDQPSNNLEAMEELAKFKLQISKL